MDDKNREVYTLEDLKYFIDNIPYAVWIKGSDGIYKYVNEYYAKVTNMNPEDIINKSDYEIRNKDISDAFIAEDREILNDGKTVLNRKTPVNMNYKNFFEVSRMIIKDDKDIKLIGGIGKDITLNENLYKEIERSTLTLLDTENKNSTDELAWILKNILQADGITIFLIDDVDKKMHIFLKTYDDDIIPWDFNLNFSEKSKTKLLKAYYQNRCFGKRYQIGNFVSNVRTYCIEFEHELIGILNVHYDNDKESNISGIHEDIIRETCRRLGIIIKNRLLANKYKIELQKREKSEKKLQTFLENTIDFYVVLNNEKNYFDFGSKKETFKKFFGYSLEEIQKRFIEKKLRYPDDDKKMEYMYKAAKICNKIQGVVIRYLCYDNEYKSIKWNITYVKEYDRFFITGKDITSKLKLEKEKKDLEKKIEIESLKTDFFANMSHEFKTPLNIILTTVQVLADKLDNQDKAITPEMLKKYLKGVKQNSYRLLKIVNNIMDITKIDSGSYKLELGNYNIVSVVEDIVDSVVEYMENNKRNIIFDTMEEEIITACDPIKIERIMLNLLSNALKYTNEGGHIKVFIDMDKELNEVIINVSNDGEPISDENKERIFERFTQSGDLLTRKREGTGIGLFLVRLLVELHGGSIYVDNKCEEGTKFVIKLPIKLLKEDSENYNYTKQIISKVETCNIEFSDIYS